MKRPMVALAALLIGVLAISADGFAGPPPWEQDMNRRIVEAKRKQAEIERTKGEQRVSLMREHLKAMEDNLRTMQSFKATPGMTMQEHEEWIAAHQKAMDELLQLMIRDQQLLSDLAK